MGKLVIDLLCISIIIGFIIDVAGFMETVKRFLFKLILKVPYVDYSIKPFDCSLCMTWWISLIYLYYQSSFTIPMICIAGVISWSTKLFTDIIYRCQDLIIYLLNTINNIANKENNHD